MTRFTRSIPLLVARTGLTLALGVTVTLWWASYRWILERHWVDLTIFPPPMGWFIVVDRTVYWGGKDGGYAVGGFGKDATVQWHAWKRSTAVSTPYVVGKFSLWGPAACVGVPAVLVWVIPIVRVWRRRRSGRCDCGYDMRGLPAGGPCPECGDPARRGPSARA